MQTDRFAILARTFSMSIVFRLICLMMLAVVASAAAQGPPAVSVPSVSLPVTGGRGQPFAALATLPPGYLEEERFLSGTATAKAKTGRWDLDGIWAVTPAATAPYTVRMLVRRPARREPLQRHGRRRMAERHGASRRRRRLHADAGGDRPRGLRVGGRRRAGRRHQCAGDRLKAWDPARYAPLAHPGDAYSYDIFSQAARAIRQPAWRESAGRIENPARPRDRTVAVSVSARHLHQRDSPDRQAVRWIFRPQPRQQCRRAFGARHSHATRRIPIPIGARIRADIDVPVFDLQTEGDMVALRSHLTRQDPARATADGKLPAPLTRKRRGGWSRNRRRSIAARDAGRR